jgi:hypothetical protein
MENVVQKDILETAVKYGTEKMGFEWRIRKERIQTHNQNK